MSGSAATSARCAFSSANLRITLPPKLKSTYSSLSRIAYQLGQDLAPAIEEQGARREIVCMPLLQRDRSFFARNYGLREWRKPHADDEYGQKKSPHEEGLEARRVMNFWAI
jgi:hypothetical protein